MTDFSREGELESGETGRRDTSPSVG